MRILITGGFGFLGARLGQHLQEMGHDITLGSRREVSPPSWLRHAKVKKMDWRDTRSLEGCCAEIDVVIHAAGMNAQDCAADPIGALEFNGVATARLVEAASNARVTQLVYLSTAHVYDSPLSGRLTESSCPRNLHPYATSHLSGEHSVLGYRKSRGLERLVLRLSNVFGAPAHQDVNCWTLLVNDLCRQALETRRLILHSSGLQQRDFIPMEDACRIIGALVGGNFATGGSGILNVGSGKSMSVLEMTELIRDRCKAIFGFTPPIHRHPDEDLQSVKALEYRIDELQKAGLVPTDSSVAEIDKLLNFCHELSLSRNGSI